MTTREAAARTKAVKSATEGLRTAIFQEILIKELSLEQVGASYMKLASYRERLQRMNDELLQSSTDIAKDLVEPGLSTVVASEHARVSFRKFQSHIPRCRR